MTEVLVYMINGNQAGNPLYVQFPQRGDVIAVNPDGFNWGTQELTNPCFRIFRVSDTALNAGTLLGQQAASGPGDQGPWNYRANYINLDGVTINALVAAAIADNSRQTPVIIVPGTVTFASWSAPRANLVAAAPT